MVPIPEALAIAFQHHQAGRLQAAEQIYRLILQAEPNHADAMHLLGVIAHQVGKHDIAVEHIERAIGLNGNVAAFHNNLGEAYLALGRIPEAVACYRQALQLKPDYTVAHNNLGAAFKDQGKLDEAVACCRRALELKPDYAEAHNNLGVAFKDQGKLDEAVACLRRALELKPHFAAAHNNLGLACWDQGKRDEALACWRRALELKPDYAEAHYNLGNAMKDQGKLDEALACYRRALELKPDYAEAHNSLGVAFTEQGKLDEAVACYHRALELKPGYAGAHSNLGLAFQNQGKLDEALACYRRALELEPDLAEAHWNRSYAWLLAGDFQRGWPEHKWGLQQKESSSRRFPQPIWDGARLEGKTLLILADQGLGDTIQFVRYASLVKELAMTVVVECQKPLLPILARCCVDHLVEQGTALPPFDVYAPLIDLPSIFRTTLDNIPAAIPYLFAAPPLVEQWRRKLSDLAGFKIGIHWQGNPAYRGDCYRSIGLSNFLALAQIPNVCLISLQKGAGSEQLAEVSDLFPIIDLAGELDEASGPLMDTAAIMMNLDLVVTSDTAIAHLAGALGVPVWVALPLAPDWRWLLDRDDSPWYPTMRLFRQRKLGDWAGVFDDIRKALRERLQSPPIDGAK